MTYQWRETKSAALGAAKINLKFFPNGAEDPDYLAPKGIVSSVTHDSTGVFTVTLAENWLNDDGYSSGLLGVQAHLTTAVAGTNTAECKGIDASAQTLTIATYDGGVLTDFELANTTFVSIEITLDLRS